MANKLWCVVSGIGHHSVFGYTHEHDGVVMKKCAEGLAGVQRGDIVEFVPGEFHGDKLHKGKDKPVKWFGSFPIIIARNVAETEAANPITRAGQNYKGAKSRPTLDAVVWKRAQELTADEAAFSEALK